MPEAPKPAAPAGDATNTIHTLPAELTDHIAKHLDDADLLNVRKTCHDLCNKTKIAFTDRFFGAVHVTLNEKGLKGLHKLAQHANYRRGVQELTFSTGHEGRRRLMSLGLGQEEVIKVKDIEIDASKELKAILSRVVKKENASRRKTARREFRTRQHKTNALSKSKVCAKAIAAAFDQFPRLRKVAISSALVQPLKEFEALDLQKNYIDMVYTVLKCLQLSQRRIREFDMHFARNFSEVKQLITALSGDALIRWFGKGIVDTLSSVVSLTVRPVVRPERYGAVSNISGLFPSITEFNIKGILEGRDLAYFTLPLSSVRLHPRLHFPGLQSVAFENLAGSGHNLASILMMYRETLRKVRISEVRLLDIGPGPNLLFTTLAGLPNLDQLSFFMVLMQNEKNWLGTSSSLSALCLWLPFSRSSPHFRVRLLIGHHDSIKLRTGNRLFSQYVGGEDMKNALDIIKQHGFAQRNVGVL